MAQASALGRPRRVIPGLGLSFTITTSTLAALVLLPLAAMVAMSLSKGLPAFVAALADRRVLAAFRVTILAALGAAVVSAVCGMLLAWVLTRYRFPGRRFIDAAVDLPFALPTAVAGIALTALYAPNGWIGALLEPLGITVAFTPLGIGVALVFVGLPFVVRAVQPILEDLPADEEEAARLLGATRTQIFLRVIMPAAAPALITGFTMAFARGLGEYGSVIFIAGNKPMLSEIVPLLIVIQLDQYNYVGAAAIGTAMLMVSFVMLMVINRLQAWAAAR